MEITKIDLGHAYKGKIHMREVLHREREPLDFQRVALDALRSFTYRDLVAASMVSHLTTTEAFAAMCYALRASNGYLAKRYFAELESFGHTGDCMAAREMLSGLAVKEAWGGLSHEEVAGLVSATMLDVMDFPAYGDRVLETCGMGGDRGLLINGDARRRKTINGSTLTALTLAALGHATTKHGSYSNTSAVGSTDAIEKLGLVVDIPNRDVQQELARSGFHYTDAHAWKTVHDLSHLQPRRETVNHVIGPMTPPVSPATRLDKVLGVNEKMGPATIAKAYGLLHDQGIFQIGNVAVVCGLSQRVDAHQVEGPHVRGLAVLDELSPFGSAVAFTHASRYLGTFALTPQDFGISFRNPFSVFVENTVEEIMRANHFALGEGDDPRQLTEFLAMNAALALYLVTAMDDDAGLLRHGRRPDRDALQACYAKCLQALQDGLVSRFLRQQVDLTHRLVGTL